ncbi:MAG: hypothetical protein IJL64_05965 [Bacteroidales bacterium]|jgi:hypothetical protein|nr:hypothetical protein [Bacteroidales bacterium]MBR3287292.1 hypothetical protein [Bacteroidales bacterium]
MKRLLLILCAACLSLSLSAQVPYFSGTVGKSKLYGYTSFKFRPGINAQQTYTTFQYGIGEQTAVGLDVTTGGDQAFEGILFRYGTRISPSFGIGAQITPTFALGDKMSFSYMTNALYMNGNFDSDGRWFWCSNTFYTVIDEADNTLDEWMYLGRNLTAFGNNLTLMAGALYSDGNGETYTDLGAGCYYTLGNYNIYLWGNDLLTKSHPRFVIGIEFVF